MLIATAFLLLQGALTSSANGTGAPAVRVPRVTEEIRIDGELSEAAWDAAARLTGFSQYQPVDGRPASEPTEVRVFFTPQAIYFGVVATATDPGTVRATLSKRDNIDNDDRVTIYLDTFNDRRRAFFFGVNPLGVQLDGVRTEGAVSAGNMFGGSVDLNPDYRFDSKGRVTDSGYVVEIRIPFKSLRFPANDPQRWGVNVVRHSPSRGAEDTWTDARRGASSFLAQSGTLEGIADVERGVVTDIQPFITQSVNGARDGDSGRFRRDARKFDGGLNLRLGFPAVALDATVNPDFSQVESDAGLVTVNERFNLFLPEKRPFFLEGIELFSTPNQLVYTRKIPDPIAGAKLTGKLGPFGIAYLSALDDTPGTGSNSLFNVARLRTDYGGNSVIGLTLTDRRSDNAANTVVAADNRIVFKRLYYFETQFGQSLTRQSGATRGAPIWKAELDRTGRIWGFNYQTYGIGQRFQSDAGFIQRTGVQYAHAYNRFSFFGRPQALVQSFTTYFGPVRFWRYGDLSRAGELEGNEGITGIVTLRGGWVANTSVTRSFFTIDSSFAFGLYTRGQAGELLRYDPSTRLSGLVVNSVGVTTPIFGRFNASASIQRGAVPIFSEGNEGREVRATASLTVRPTTGTRLEGTLVRSRIERARDGSEYARVIIPRIKAEYQPTRALFFRVVSQYRADRINEPRDRLAGLPLYDRDGAALAASDRRQLGTDWLISYEPTPGTVAYLGYGDGLQSAGTLADTRMRRVNDGLFVKVSYLFRR